jgi:hypothetical protein
MGQNKKGINETAGKIIGKEKRPQKIAGFHEVCKIVLGDKKRAYSKMINRYTKQS